MVKECTRYERVQRELKAICPFKVETSLARRLLADDTLWVKVFDDMLPRILAGDLKKRPKEARLVGDQLTTESKDLALKLYHGAFVDLIEKADVSTVRVARKMIDLDAGFFVKTQSSMRLWVDMDERLAGRSESLIQAAAAIPPPYYFQQHDILKTPGPLTDWEVNWFNLPPVAVNIPYCRATIGRPATKVALKLFGYYGATTAVYQGAYFGAFSEKFEMHCALGRAWGEKNGTVLPYWCCSAMAEKFFILESGHAFKKFMFRPHAPIEQKQLSPVNSPKSKFLRAFSLWGKSVQSRVPAPRVATETILDDIADDSSDVRSDT